MLLVLYSTLAQPVFDDSENLSDTQEISQGFGRISDDTEGLTDTVLVTREAPSTDNTVPTDTVSLGQSSTQTDNTSPTDIITTVQNFVSTSTDNAGPSDTTSISQSKAFTDNESLSDTADLVLGKGFEDPINGTDTFFIDSTVAPMDSESLTESLSVDLVVVFTDGAGVTDTGEYYRDVVVFDGIDSDDSIISAINYEREFLEDGSILSDAIFELNVVITDGVGCSDVSVATREYTFIDSTNIKDTFKKVKSSPPTNIEVGRAEVRWLIG